jgi:methionyl-tRNA synthetase
VDEISNRWKQLWQELKITNDDFIRTTEERHIKVVQYLITKWYENQDIYKDKYKGWYCTACETFWIETQFEEKKCPNSWCGRELKWVEEENYFFKLSKFQEKILKHLENNKDFVKPEIRYNEVYQFVKRGLEDICISRRGLKWGIPLPFDEKYVLYVWIDALINYLTVCGFLEDEEKFKKFWPADLHLIGKDILRFHAIIWPALLLASNLPLPKKIFATGFWNVEGEKMSKSKGNVIKPKELLEKISQELEISPEISLDLLRYFLLREIHLGTDGNFTQDSLFARYNSELADDLGNLLMRTLSMIKKYQNGKILKGEINIDMQNLTFNTIELVEKYFDNLEFSFGLIEIWNLIKSANRYIEESAPWNLAKENKLENLKTVLYTLSDILSRISIMIEPVMPQTAISLRKQLGLELKGENLWKYLKEKKIIPKESQIGQIFPLFPKKKIRR